MLRMTTFVQNIESLPFETALHEASDKLDKACSQTSCAVVASLIARVHGKVRSLSKSSSLVQPFTEQSYSLRSQLRFA